jgi:hypothetical protein
MVITREGIQAMFNYELQEIRGSFKLILPQVYVYEIYLSETLGKNSPVTSINGLHIVHNI